MNSINGCASDQPIDRVLAALEAHGCAPKPSGDGWTCRCPAHEDRSPSLTISVGENGGALLFCHAGCSTESVVASLGMTLAGLMPADSHRNGAPKARTTARKAKGAAPKAREPGSTRNDNRKIAALYDYLDEAGELLFQVVRYEPKGFRQRKPKPGGGWDWRVKGTRAVPYRLLELLAADPEATVFIVEGERDVENLRSIGIVATCNAGGAGKWLTEYAEFLRGRRVVVVPDNDQAGRNHAQQVAQSLQGIAAEVRILELSELPAKGDVSDWIDAHGDACEPETMRAELERLADAAPVWSPEAKPEAGPEAERAAAIDGCIPLGQRDPETGRLVLSTAQTLPTAEAFVREHFSHDEGRTIHDYCGELWQWRDGRYVPLEDGFAKNTLQDWLHNSLRYVAKRGTDQMELQNFPSNPNTIKAALESIKTHVHLSSETACPSWFGASSDRPAPGEIIACRSTLLHLPTMQRLPASPAFFSTSALEFDPEPNAPAPSAWKDFLGALFGEDTESIELLQEWFGYLLTADTRQQKMLLIVGPKRSGKGTIARVLSRLVGAGNVVGPTTSSLAGPFGLQPMIGKSLAIVSDARFHGDSISTVIERLLCISGEDAVTVDRKFMVSVTLKLPTRFMFLTNEHPRLADASGALAGRFLVLRLTESFYGREDTVLTDRLLRELPGILNWGIEGWHRLDGRGHFVMPQSVEDVVQNIGDLASPVGTFIREVCVVGPEHRIAVDELYLCWQSWCARDGRNLVSNKQIFGRDLMAAVPAIRCRQGTYGRFYEGIGVK